MSAGRYLLVLFVWLLTGTAALAQTPNQLLHDVYAKSRKAKDYSAKANIKVDMPFIKMLPIDATIYYKQKDKFRVISKGIAIVPRQGFDQVSKMLADTSGFTCMQQGSEMIGKTATKIINIIPLSDTTDLILGRLWVDDAKDVVLRSQLTTKTNGTILTDYTYGSQEAYGLPDAMVFTVDVKKFKVPKGLAGETSNSKENASDKKKDPKKGRIFITLSNYQVNKGIPDSVFNKK